MKLWDVWVYEAQDLGGLLVPPNEEQAAEHPEPGLPGETAEEVASRVIGEELALVLEDLEAPTPWAVAIREHGSGQPFRLFSGTAALTLTVLVGQVSEATAPDWTAE